MKVFYILIISATVITGCSKEEKAKKSSNFNPPSWIQGNWETQSTVNSKWTFTSDNLIYEDFAGITEYDNIVTQEPSIHTITENVASDSYYVEILTDIGGTSLKTLDVMFYLYSDGTIRAVKNYSAQELTAEEAENVYAAYLKQ